jgi:hypothetical protein
MPSPPTETERLCRCREPRTPRKRRLNLPGTSERPPKGDRPLSNVSTVHANLDHPTLAATSVGKPPNLRLAAAQPSTEKWEGHPCERPSLPSGLTTERLIVVAERRAVRVVAGVLARLRAALEVAGLTSPRAVAESGGWSRNGNRERGHDARNALTPTHRTLLRISWPLPEVLRLLLKRRAAPEVRNLRPMTWPGVRK